MSSFLDCGCDYAYMEDEIRGDRQSEPLDLVMWVYNGEATLEESLRSINIAAEHVKVGQRIVIDDGSRDSSKAIATRLGWRVVHNEGKGISDAANFALKIVGSKRFCSFEQDLVLNSDWFLKVPNLIKEGVVAASGVRAPLTVRSLAGIGYYEANRFKGDFSEPYGHTLDNTCYDTQTLIKLGGFPKVEGGPGVDVRLLEKIKASGGQWVVNSDVCSNHLRRGVWEELQHYYWYGKCQSKVDASPKAYAGLLARALFSPLRGLDIAFDRENLGCAFVYPAIRFASLAGAINGYVMGRS